MLTLSLSVDDPGRVKTQVVIASVEYFRRIAPHESQIMLPT
jgi:hypothetical protein